MAPELTKIQAIADQNARRFVEMYATGEPADAICEAMGWSTGSVDPAKRISLYANRLRKRGYEVPYRQGQG